MVARLLLACSALALVAGCGRSAPPPAAAPAAQVQPPPEPAKREPTLAERLATAAPAERPENPPWDAVLPGMAADDIARLLGAPDEVRESESGRARLAWRTGGEHDPLFLVWLHDGVAERMRLVDRF